MTAFYCFLLSLFHGWSHPLSFGPDPVKPTSGATTHREGDDAPAWTTDERTLITDISNGV